VVSSKKKTWHPSAIPLNFGPGILSTLLVKIIWGTPAEMSEMQIQQVIQNFVRAAKVAKEIGFHGVKVHAAHGYLLSVFLSAKANQRTDAWGGSAAKRTAIVVLIIREKHSASA
jgi:2,4-dienoyl-CoA reductase-like NADH-dependent reductase (Old Yellow Enzyme family)